MLWPVLGKRSQRSYNFMTRKLETPKLVIASHNAGKVADQLGWVPKETSATGFRKTVQWYLDNETWWQDILSGDYRLERLGRS